VGIIVQNPPGMNPRPDATTHTRMGLMCNPNLQYIIPTCNSNTAAVLGAGRGMLL